MGFRQRVAYGPMQRLRRQRRKAAHGLIQAITSGNQPPLNLRQVVQRCGSINVSAFSRDVPRLHGLPPSQLLRRRH